MTTGVPGCMIPLYDLKLAPEDLEAVAATLRSGRLVSGAGTAAFEEAFAAHLGCRHAVAVSSCTAALHLAYLAAGVGPGTEVIVPSMTFAATAAAVIYCGGTPVFADIVGLEDPSIDPERVRALITPRTRAVTAVHFAGYAAPIAALRDLCDEHGLALIEDAAHAPSATAIDPRGAGTPRKLGTWGVAGCFSFFSNKILSVGEGGLLATDDDEVARLVRAHAVESPLDEPRAALLSSRLTRLEDDIELRRGRTRRYRAALDDLDGLSLPYPLESVDVSSCYVMPATIDDVERRDDVRAALRAHHGVQTSLLYPAIHEFTAYRERFPGTDLPRTERFARAEITLPLFPHLGDEDQDRVVAALETELAR